MTELPFVFTYRPIRPVAAFDLPAYELQRFDPRAEGVRGDGDIRLFDPSAYVDKAWEIGEHLASEGRGTCALDLAMVGTDIVVVELNPILNSGLYASDPYALYEALVSKPHTVRAHVSTIHTDPVEEL